jgi:phosphoribosylamine--glycine ligase
MGAYSFSGLLDEQMTHWLTHIAIPVIEGMKAEGMEYKGILYCGLMMTPHGPMVLEFAAALAIRKHSQFTCDWKRSAGSD